SYVPFMQYAAERALREQMYRAYVTRASEFGKPELDNTPLITQILRLHHEAALLLGYANHAEVSLVPKMAQTPRPSWASPNWRPGISLMPRKSCARRATLFPTRK